ncbi:distal tail protein Dit [Enterococcus mundtii]|uniref:distal tail protein Dit n=1 Tax=Enterococcus mundtii TaxID=53346 RepID=UPI001376D8AC|nr:distal tail protein Dit [Enterococcus mundtii]NBA63391.1 phage tail protein [Enterococcus mundtii]
MTSEPYFEFNGHKSTAKNLYLLNEMELTIPESDLRFDEVDGRQGAIIYDNEREKDIIKTFPMELRKETDKSLFQQVREITHWLKEPKRYSRLLFSEDPDYFYEGVFYSQVRILDRWRDHFDVVLPFRCKPVMYRVDGQTTTPILTGRTLENPEPINSLPLIQFRYSGTADATLTINERQFRILRAAGSGLITIDSELGTASRDGIANISNAILMQSDGYHAPELQPGTNTISFTTQITQMTITPRWRVTAI